jgi:hypothetical protein
MGDKMQQRSSKWRTNRHPHGSAELKPDPEPEQYAYRSTIALTNHCTVTTTNTGSDIHCTHIRPIE